MRRQRSILAVAVVLTSVGSTLLTIGPAAASANPVADFVAVTNAARAAHGLRSLTVAADLTASAQRHAGLEAARHTIFHDDALASEISGWLALGQNTGLGGSVAQIQAAFMASAPHRDNILGGSYTDMGIGVVVSHGLIYVDEIFRESAHHPAAPQRRTVTHPAPAPHSAPPAAVGHTTSAVRPAVARRSAPVSSSHGSAARPSSSSTVALATLLAAHTRATDPLASSVGWWSALTSG